MAIYIATIRVAVDVDGEGEACDAIAEMLRPNLQAFAPESCFIDWAYCAPIAYPHPATAAEVAAMEYQPKQREGS